MPMFGPARWLIASLSSPGGGEAVGEIAAAETRAVDAPLLLLGHQLEIAAAGRHRAFDNPVGDGGDGAIESHAAPYSCQLMPSRSVSAMAAEGPQVPAA